MFSIDSKADENSIADFGSLDFEDSICCGALERLSLRNNRLSSLTMREAAVPNLRHLNIDDNRFSSFDGFSSLRLTSLSARRQQPVLGQSVAPDVLHRIQNVQSLALSGTHIPTFTMPSDGLANLTHLELASCGLQQLPDDFGFLVPSLKHLNLNFNNLKDIRALLGCKNLQTLLLANNRISRLRKGVMVLERLGKRLTELDLRGNLVTNGFYDTTSRGFATVQKASKETQVARTNRELERLDKLPLPQQAIITRLNEDAETAPYLLASMDTEADTQYLGHLDEDTKLRRRVYELLLGNALPKLHWLDGGPFDKKQKLAKDDVWLRLAELGVLKRR
ncbi:MAG: leucine-rich repeat domain-containing protein [Terriglobus roseus]|nr:leucine-rich repeat domain-containing protein [Terriglobus roseus]